MKVDLPDGQDAVPFTPIVDTQKPRVSFGISCR